MKELNDNEHGGREYEASRESYEPDIYYDDCIEFSKTAPLEVKSVALNPIVWYLLPKPQINNILSAFVQGMIEIGEFDAEALDEFEKDYHESIVKYLKGE